MRANRVVSTLWHLPSYGLLVAASVVALGPVLWVLANSVKTLNEMTVAPLSLPHSVQWANYAEAWSEGHLDRYFANTFLVAAFTILMVVAAAVLAGFAFARLRFPGNRLLFFGFFFGMTIPTPIVLGPLLSLMFSLRLTNSLPGLALAYAGHQLPFAILLTRSFFRQFPVEIEEAARVDGCSGLALLWRIILPLSLPALAVLIVLAFMNVWNEFFIALMLINSDKVKTVSLGLVAFQGEFATQYHLALAGIVISALPVIAVYILFQRGFIRGITSGALK